MPHNIVLGMRKPQLEAISTKVGMAFVIITDRANNPSSKAGAHNSGAAIGLRNLSQFGQRKEAASLSTSQCGQHSICDGPRPSRAFVISRKDGMAGGNSSHSSRHNDLHVDLPDFNSFALFHVVRNRAIRARCDPTSPPTDATSNLNRPTRAA